MTLDEAIKHCLEVAEQNEFETRIYDELNRQGDEEYRNNHCQCAADHRQLAEWLTELKVARQYLMEAVDGFRALGKYLDEQCEIYLDCDKCPLRNGGNCRQWEHTKAVMKLIGGKQ